VGRQTERPHIVDSQTVSILTMYIGEPHSVAAITPSCKNRAKPKSAANIMTQMLLVQTSYSNSQAKPCWPYTLEQLNHRTSTFKHTHTHTITHTKFSTNCYMGSNRLDDIARENKSSESCTVSIAIQCYWPPNTSQHTPPKPSHKGW